MPNTHNREIHDIWYLTKNLPSMQNSRNIQPIRRRKYQSTETDTNDTDAKLADNSIKTFVITIFHMFKKVKSEHVKE